ncbi:MAG: polysaccharide biosynthesis tyrosine autokinase [Pseudomonadota bacterium]
MNRQMTHAAWRGAGPGHGGGDAPGRQTDEIGLAELFRCLLRNAWLVAVAGALGAGLAALVVSQIAPVYTSTSQVMLDTRERQVTTAAEVISGLEPSDAVIETEVQVVQSNLLIDRVVRAVGPERLGEYDGAVQKPGLLARLFGAEAPSLPEEPAERTVRIDAITAGLLGNLDVWQQGSSYVLNIAVTSEDPALAAELADTIARTYIAAQLDLRTEGTRHATEWLTARVAELERDVEASQTAVERFRLERGLPGDGVGPLAAPRELDALSAEIASARADHLAAKARLGRISEAREAGGNAAVADLLGSPLLETLRSERASLSQSVADLAARYGPRHPERARAAAALARVDANIDAEIDRNLDRLSNEVAVGLERERTLVTVAKGLERRIAEMSEAEIELRQLQLEAAANERVYQDLLSRLMETRTQEALAQPDATQIASAVVPKAPTHPRTKLIVALGAMLGMLLAAGGALGRELMRTGYRSAAQLEAETGHPILATLPRPPSPVPARLSRHIALEPHCPFAESVRLLRTSLEPAEDARGGHAVLVTSTAEGEGRSTTALALATMFQRSGRRALLLDADFHGRSPWRTHACPEGQDLAAALLGHVAPEAAVCFAQDLGIDILAGAGPALSLSDTLTAEHVRAFLNRFRALYDVIVIDGPALDRVADLDLLAEAADTLAYVVRSRRTPASAVQRGLAILAALGHEPRGLVLTHIAPESVGIGWGTEQSPLTPRREPRALKESA